MNAGLLPEQISTLSQKVIFLYKLQFNLCVVISTFSLEQMYFGYQKIRPRCRKKVFEFEINLHMEVEKKVFV